MKVPLECKNDGCVTRAVKRGMCNTHYQQWRKATPPDQRRRPIAEQRFEALVRRGNPEECWPWTGGTTDRGYGTFAVSSDLRMGAHRYAFWQANGYMADQVDHTCHNGSGCAGGNSCPHRRCCNPAHLENTSNLVNSLRGESVAAYHARKTHCVNGHEFSPENTYVYRHRGGRPRRFCKQCNRDRQTAKRRQGEAA